MRFDPQKTREEVEAALYEILESPEFQDERTFWDEFWDWLDRNFDVGEAVALGDVLKGVLIVILIVTTILYAVLWYRTLRARERLATQGGRPMVSTLERARALAEEARAARQRGDERGAVRLYLHALIMGFSREGGLAYRDAWTNRELLRRGAPSPRVRDELDSLVRRYEPKEFGREDILAEDLDALEALARRELGGAGVPA